MSGRGSEFRFAAFYADDAEWIEYRHFSPPRSPNRMIGKQQTSEFLRQTSGADLGIVTVDETIGGHRSALLQAS